ncbi:hypothetical protein SteCoe_10750 [Stentor coeruleus]|uniref:Kinetochore protein SPC25 n=1 Tax=Stentor coeruleus TaxID=5963 RepID=A0A1R2CEP6_9CILI|nr:hypothetical protein SteCoe_10750 [Stentor coeruleus]
MEKDKVSDIIKNIDSEVFNTVNEMIDNINTNSLLVYKNFIDNDNRYIACMKDLMYKIEVTQNNIKNNIKVLEILQQQKELYEKYSIMLKCQEFIEIKDTSSSIEEIRKKEDNQAELEKYQKIVEAYEKSLGIIIKIQRNVMNFYFLHMGSGSLNCCLSVIKNNDLYILNKCTPFVPSMSSIVENFNIFIVFFMDYCEFLKAARKAFSKHLEVL